MKIKYECRMPDQDGDDAWNAVEAGWPEEAARVYAEDCDFNSGGDLFNDCGEHVVIIKDSAGTEWKFKCTMELMPSYSAEELDPKPEPISDIPL